jgi:hypothetical protein
MIHRLLVWTVVSVYILIPSVSGCGVLLGKQLPTANQMIKAEL